MATPRHARHAIPHRIDEGYGLNAEALGQICEQGAKVIVVDRDGAGAGAPDLASVLGGVRLVRRTPVLLGANGVDGLINALSPGWRRRSSRVRPSSA